MVTGQIFARADYAWNSAYAHCGNSSDRNKGMAIKPESAYSRTYVKMTTGHNFELAKKHWSIQGGRNLQWYLLDNLLRSNAKIIQGFASLSTPVWQHSRIPGGRLGGGAWTETQQEKAQTMVLGICEPDNGNLEHTFHDRRKVRLLQELGLWCTSSHRIVENAGQIYNTFKWIYSQRHSERQKWQPEKW